MSTPVELQRRTEDLRKAQDTLTFIRAELARGDSEARDLIAKVKWPDCMAALVNLYSDVLRNINAAARDGDGS